MTTCNDVLENFKTNVAYRVYDAVEAVTSVPLRLKSEAQSLEKELAEVRSRIKALEQGTVDGPVMANEPIRLDPALTPDMEVRSENAKKCLTMCSRMTACQAEGTDRIICGGVVLRAGTTADEIQANWDLIDTVTGADA